MVTNEAEERVSKFYNTVGWESEEDVSEDARRWEDLREHAREYVSRCRLRVLKHIPENGEFILDMASGPIQYPEYLEYSKNFRKRYCVDLSSAALDSAKKKIGDHGEFFNGSFFDIKFEEDFFDCAVSLHTIYHIDKERQEEAVRKLIKITKKGKPIIIVYSNPRPLIYAIRDLLFLRILKKIKRIFEKESTDSNLVQENGLYSFRYPIQWWERFRDVADMKIVPWRSFDAEIQRRYIPNNRIGSMVFDLVFALEERFPNFFVKHFQYPMIVLTKKDRVPTA